MESLPSSNYSILKYHCNSEQLNRLQILIVCDEPQAKRKIAEALAEVKTDFSINIHTTKTLPMKAGNSSLNFDFLVFLIDLSKRFSQMNVEESLCFVDAKYFLKQSCFVAIHNVDPVVHSCDLDDIKELETKYNIPVFHANFSDTNSICGLAQRIINSSSIACWLRGSIGTSHIEVLDILMQNPLDSLF